jgi:hypothetical protein
MDHIAVGTLFFVGTGEDQQKFGRSRLRGDSSTRANKMVIVCMVALADDIGLRIGVLSQTRRHPFETFLAGKKRTTPAMAPAA